MSSSRGRRSRLSRTTRPARRTATSRLKSSASIGMPIDTGISSLELLGGFVDDRDDALVGCRRRSCRCRRRRCWPARGPVREGHLVSQGPTRPPWQAGGPRQSATTNGTERVSSLSGVLRKNEVDLAPVLLSRGALLRPVRRVVQLIGHLRWPEAPEMAVEEIALDRLAQPGGAAGAIDFPARREDRRAAERDVRRPAAAAAIAPARRRLRPAAVSRVTRVRRASASGAAPSR